jgi:Tfp pilus assembly protein PilO
MNKKLDTKLVTIVGLVAAAVLIGGGGYLMVVSPQMAKTSKTADEIAMAQTELVVAQGAAARPVPFHASDLYRLANAMPSTTDMPGVLLGLRHLAGRSAVKVTAIKPSAPVTLALGYSAVPLSLAVSGNYWHVTKFLGLVRRSVRLVGGTELRVNGRLFDTDSISLQQGATGDVLTAALSLVAFVYTGQVAPATTTTAGSTGSTTTGTTTTTSTTAH